MPESAANIEDFIAYLLSTQEQDDEAHSKKRSDILDRLKAFSDYRDSQHAPQAYGSNVLQYVLGRTFAERFKGKPKMLKQLPGVNKGVKGADDSTNPFKDIIGLHPTAKLIQSLIGF
jgi:hypothetical protein